jgi:hypothetical protein
VTATSTHSALPLRLLVRQSTRSSKVGLQGKIESPTRRRGGVGVSHAQRLDALA